MSPVNNFKMNHAYFICDMSMSEGTVCEFFYLLC